MNINFLMPIRGNVATKTFEFKNEWRLIKSYKAGKFFKGFEIEVSDIDKCFEMLQDNQEYPVFMIHGGIIEGTNTEKMIRRKRSDHKDGLKPTITDRYLNFFCLDIDGYDGSIEKVIKELPESFQSADYIYQYSSSYGLTTDKLKCHLFFYLDEPVHNLEISEWIKKYNKHKDWGNIIDHLVLGATQPVYIQKRICQGALDPIDEFIGIIKKDGNLKWSPNIVEEIDSNKNKLSLNTIKNKYDLSAGVEKILISENYHEELNSLALSLINRRVPPNTVKSMLQGAMNAAKRGLTSSQDSQRLEDWQIRFNDIGRSVDTAAAIVNNPDIEEVLEWIQSSTEFEVKGNFADKCLKLSPIDKTIAIREIVDKINFGINDVKKTIKIAEEEDKKERQIMAKEAKTLERESNGIYEIEITPTNAFDVVKKVGSIMANSEKNPKLFTIAGSLARVDIGTPTTIRQISKSHEMGIDYPKIPVIRPYRKPFYSLGSRISKDIVFQNNGTDIEPPSKIVYEIGQAEDIKFKPLAGIVENPYIDINWSLVQEEGYNPQTGLYTMLHHKLKIKKVNPLDAYEYLTEVVFDEFPFSEELDAAVAVSALMTCIMRPTIAGDAGIPGFGIVSPIQSSGKTTLAQLISYSIYNRPVAASSWSADEEELGKHILAILQEGHSCVLFDNIQQGATVQSSRLANAMSNDIFGGRQLGENKTIEVPSSVIWIFTGNGIRFVGDFATRVYPININPNMANPNTRIFKREDIGQWAMENRKKIISAVLSIIVNGKDMEPIKGSTRFKLWDKFVRRPLYKVSGIDVNEAVTKNQNDDPLKLMEMNLIEQLYETFDDKKFTTKDLTDIAFYNFDGQEKENELASILIDLLDKKARNKRSIGRYLSSLVDVVLGNYSLKKKVSNVIHWYIYKMEV